MEGGNGVNEPINFAPLSADAREKPVEMESLCVQCEENVSAVKSMVLLIVVYGHGG